MDDLTDAIARQMRGDLEVPIAIYERVLEADPDNHRALHFLGLALFAKGEVSRACSLVDRSIAVNPSKAIYHSNYGFILYQLERFDEAIIAYEKSLTIKGGDIDVILKKANALKKIAERSATIDSASLSPSETAAANLYNKIITLYPSIMDAYVNYGALLFNVGKVAEAIQVLTHGLNSHPESPELRFNLGVVYSSSRRFSEAISLFDAAERARPGYQEPIWARGLVHLGRGEFGLGWVDYDKRVKKPISTSRPRWVGEGEAGRLLVCGEQGLGDEVFFASGLSLLSVLSEQAVVQVDRRLVGLFERSFPGTRFVSAEEKVEESTYDRYMLLGSIFHALQGRVEEPERRTRGVYLKADVERARAIREELGVLPGQRLCGITWRSQRAEFGDKKSLRLEDLRPILETPGVRFVSLQYGDVSAELEEFRARSGIEILQCASVDNFNDIDGHAALIEACDECVLISNTTAHIAGALGKKTKVLMLRGRGRLFYWNNRIGKHSFWYPNLELFDQNLEFKWDNAVNQVRDRLTSLV